MTRRRVKVGRFFAFYLVELGAAAVHLVELGAAAVHLVELGAAGATL